MSAVVQFLEGDQVRYVPRHAHGDDQHPDCEHGEVTSTNGDYVFVRFDGKRSSQSCDPDTLQLVSRP